jgi:hypothetical protein
MGGEKIGVDDTEKIGVDGTEKIGVDGRDLKIVLK